MTAIPLVVILLVIAVGFFAVSRRWKKAAPGLRRAFLIVGALTILFIIWLILQVQSAGPTLHK